MPILRGLASLLIRVFSGFAIRATLKNFGRWLLQGLMWFFFSKVGALLVIVLAEILPRFLGLGQGLFSWFFGWMAKAAMYAVQYAFDFVGVTLPSFNALLSGLPDGTLNILALMRVHRVIFILISIPIFNLVRSIVAKTYFALSNSTNASALISRGR